MKKGYIFSEYFGTVILLFLAVFLFLVAASLDLMDIEQKVLIESTVTQPNKAELSFHSFSQLSTQDYKIRDMTVSEALSAYIITDDEKFKNILKEKLNKMFTDKPVQIIIRDEIINNEMAKYSDWSEKINIPPKYREDFYKSTMILPLPNGKLQQIEFRFWKVEK